MSNKLTQKKQTFSEISLDKGEVGKSYKIISCFLLPDIKTRLAEMGLVPGTVVTVLKKSPLGDPIEFSVRGYALCIRATEAEHFLAEEVTL